jgi:hypothetical protein
MGGRLAPLIAALPRIQQCEPTESSTLVVELDAVVNAAEPVPRETLGAEFGRVAVATTHSL